MVYETVVDWEYEQKCSTSYEEECHGYGYHQECEKVSCQETLYLQQLHGEPQLQLLRG